MDPRVIRLEVFDFIRDNFTMDDFARARFEETPYFRAFEVYDEFLRDQVRILNLVPLAQLERYRIAVQDVRNQMIQTVDLDAMHIQTAVGFFLNQGRIVYTYHP